MASLAPTDAALDSTNHVNGIAPSFAGSSGLGTGSSPVAEGYKQIGVETELQAPPFPEGSRRRAR